MTRSVGIYPYDYCILNTMSDERYLIRTLLFGRYASSTIGVMSLVL